MNNLSDFTSSVNKLALKLALSSCLLAFASQVMAKPYTATKNKACPGLWEPTTKVIPVIRPSTLAYSAPADAQNESERAAGVIADVLEAKTHINSRGVIDTLDDSLTVNGGHVITSPLPSDDLLSIASECLVYRNLEVDAAKPSTTAPLSVNTDNGWMPAVIF